MLLRNIEGSASSAYSVSGTAGFCALFMVLFLTIGYAEGLYHGRSRYGSFDEVASLARTTLAVTSSVGVLNIYPFDRLVPFTVPFLVGAFAFCLTGAIRYGWRLTRERLYLPKGADVQRVLIIGGGEGGHQLISAMRRDERSPYLPVGIIDDHPAKRRLRISGVPVHGGRASIAEAAERTGATGAVIAIPSASAELVRELADAIRHAGLTSLVLPPVGDLIGGQVEVEDVRVPTEADLLGRREIRTDLDSIAGYVTGNTVLVTGAGGSIGSELSRQLHQLAPARLVLLDRDESGLHAAQLSIDGRALLDSDDLVVADIRDRERIRQVFEDVVPDVVFHAAALKHLTLLERHPLEAVKTNVIGTQNVLEAAAAVGVKSFVNISTDKAADAICVLGYTKRIAERLTAGQGETASGRYVSVRFGNVLGSRGSVLTAFRAQIQAGGPVTVTSKDVTRYFMTVEEAVQLVVQAGAIGQSGDVLVLDMGRPVRIYDLACQLTGSASRPIDIVFTGLRPGEKLSEVLHGIDEHPEPSEHKLITRVTVPSLRFEEIGSLAIGDEALVGSLARAACRA